MIAFYKNSNDVRVVGREISNREGDWKLSYHSNNTYAKVTNFKITIIDNPITEIVKNAQGDKYTSFAEFNNAVAPFFVNAPLEWGNITGSIANQADLAQLAGDVEQLAYVKINNEAVNGNFENGLIAPFSRSDGNGGASTLAINSSTPISGSYDVRFTITTPSTAGSGRPIFRGFHGAANIGDKIYLHFYAKILSGILIILSIHDGAYADKIYGGDVIDGRNTRVIDAMGVSDSLGIIYFNSDSVWDMQMDNFMRINLTETFGAGNEPTEEEMNLLLDIAGISYIDDEVIIPAQKIMQWQLAMIRQNKNAIIALGGTII